MAERYKIEQSFREWRRLHGVVESMNPDGEPSLKFTYRAEGAEKRPPLTIAALPAAFNPLTAAHIELLDTAEVQKSPSELILILDKKTIDKELYGASLEDRLIMLELIAGDRGRISVAFSSHGLFIDKAKALNKIYPNGTALYFIVGYDTLVRLFDSKYYEKRDEALDDLFSISRFLAANRGKSNVASVQELLSLPQNRKYERYVEPISISDRAAALSSTEIRSKVENEGELVGLVPPRIENFIRETGLYRAVEEGADAHSNLPKNRYEIRSDIMYRLCSTKMPPRRDVHVGEMVEALMQGEDIGVVVERSLKKPGS